MGNADRHKRADSDANLVAAATVLANAGKPSTLRMVESGKTFHECCAWIHSQKILRETDAFIAISNNAEHLAEDHESLVAADAVVALLELHRTAIEHHNACVDITGDDRKPDPPRLKVEHFRTIRDALARKLGRAPATSNWRELAISDQPIRDKPLLIKLRATGAVFVCQPGTGISADLASAIEAVADFAP